ncbi:uncharacterized protein LOC101747773 isoform X3 [Gallus gallus]|uniref:uncharacterized protein LOC101747773 isoform X3 n=1 Tax=Gallus gallus TaxID=9031 RepID=UPI001F011EA5|nr:uncharacterized protein LOC101747773 isoform X3 [Gallus gallus]
MARPFSPIPGPGGSETHRLRNQGHFSAWVNWQQCQLETLPCMREGDVFRSIPVSFFSSENHLWSYFGCRSMQAVPMSPT